MCAQIDVLLVGDDSRASATALALLLALVLVTGVMDGTSQGAVFVDASQAGPHCTQVCQFPVLLLLLLVLHDVMFVCGASQAGGHTTPRVTASAPAAVRAIGAVPRGYASQARHPLHTETERPAWNRLLCLNASGHCHSPSRVH